MTVSDLLTSNFLFNYIQVDRRLVAQDWTRKLHVIQAKAADAVKELPPGFLGQFNGKSILHNRLSIK